MEGVDEMMCAPNGVSIDWAVPLQEWSVLH